MYNQISHHNPQDLLNAKMFRSELLWAADVVCSKT
jgi:hypothetical protein